MVTSTPCKTNKVDPMESVAPRGLLSRSRFFFAFHNLPVEQMKPQMTNASLGVRSLGPCNRAYDISDYLRSPLSFTNVFRTWAVAGHVADLVEPVEEDQFDPWKAG